MPKSAHRRCAACGSVFTARKATSKYCSRECKCVGQQKERKTLTCANCGKLFTLVVGSQKDLKTDRSDRCCSSECRYEYVKGANARGYKGGYVDKSQGVVMVYLDHDKYTAAHRVVAMKAMRRRLQAGEVVLHVNRDKSDNRVDNLYVCESMSHYGKIRNGSLHWPTKSNLPE